MHENSVSLTDTVKNDVISKVFKNHSDIAYGFVRVLTQRFMNSFGFSKTPDSTLVDVIATDLLDAMKYETLEDFLLFFKYARMGKLGVTGRGIDSNLIIGDWLPKYLELKAEEREKQWNKEKQGEGLVAKAVEEFYKKEELKKKANEELAAAKAHVENITKDMTRDALERTIEMWSETELGSKYVYLLKLKRREIK